MIPTFHLFRPAPDGAGPFQESMLQARSRHPHQAIRVPHHSASLLGMTGTMRATTDGALLQVVPGECLLADGGVLILDELPEFKAPTVEAIAVIFRHQVVRLACRQSATVVDIPARFSIHATAAWCPCGVHPRDRCRCTEGQLDRFNKRLGKFEKAFTDALHYRLGGEEFYPHPGDLDPSNIRDVQVRP